MIIPILLIFLVLNVSVFVSYQRSLPGEGLYEHVLEYSSSNSFKAVNTGLILPIFFLALESQFNLSGAIKERLRSEKEKRIERQWECVQKTIGMWNDLNNLTSEIVYFKKSDQGATKGDTQSTKNIETILQRIENFDNSANEIVNMWHFRFSNLTIDNTGLFVDLLNVLLNSAITVAQHIRVIDDKDKICELQDSLGAIQDGIRGILYHSMLSILKSSIKLKSEDLTVEKKREIKTDIQDLIIPLKIWSKRIERREREYNEFFSYIEEDERKDIRAQIKACEEWRRDNPKKHPDDWPHMADLVKKLFWEIKHEKICGAIKIPYSLEYIRNLAEWFTSQEVIQMIKERTEPHNEI
ncbi:hypothetical protein ES703_61133 [subsurface metagenome]